MTVCERGTFEKAINVEQAFRTLEQASNVNQTYCSGGILVLAFPYVRSDSLFRVRRS